MPVGSNFIVMTMDIQVLRIKNKRWASHAGRRIMLNFARSYGKK